VHVQLLDVGLVGFLVGHHGLSHHADAAQVTPHGIHGRQDHIEAHVKLEAIQEVWLQVLLRAHLPRQQVMRM